MPVKIQKKIIKRRLLAHGDYSSISNCRANIFAIFRNIFIMFCGISKYLCIYCNIFFSEPLTMICGTLSFRGTLFEKHCHILNCVG